MNRLFIKVRGADRTVLINVDRLSDVNQFDGQEYCQLYFGGEDTQIKVLHSLDEIIEKIRNAEMESIIDRALRGDKKATA